MNHMMGTVVNLWITYEQDVWTTDSSQFIFVSLLQYMCAELTAVPYDTSVWWLNFGEIFKRLWDLQEEILMIVNMKDKDLMFPQLKYKDWKTDVPGWHFGISKQLKCDFSVKRPTSTYTSMYIIAGCQSRTTKGE